MNPPVTILRPAYFMQNDFAQKAPLLGDGIFGIPLGHADVAMVDIRVIAEAAAVALPHRERAEAR